MARLQQYPLRFEPEERAAWQAAADKADLPLAQWIRAACNVAAKREQTVQQLATTLAIPTEALDVAEDGLNHWATATCPHPAKERTSYGICRACGQTVKVKQ